MNLIGESNEVLVNLASLFGTGFNLLMPNNQQIKALLLQFEGNPLSEYLLVGTEQLQQGEVTREGMEALAVAITVLDSTIYDAIHSSWLGERYQPDDPELKPFTQEPASDLRGLLIEFAMLGFNQIPPEKLESVGAIIGELEQSAENYRLVTLLHGFINEVMRYSQQQKPAYHLRWMLLWSRLMFYQKGIPTAESIKIRNATFHPVGITIKGYEHIFSLHIHGVLEQKKELLWSKIQFSSYKLSDFTIGECMEQLISTNPQISPLVSSDPLSNQLTISGTLTHGLIKIDKLTVRKRQIRKKVMELGSQAVMNDPMVLANSLIWLEIPVSSGEDVDRLKELGLSISEKDLSKIKNHKGFSLLKWDGALIVEMLSTVADGLLQNHQLASLEFPSSNRLQPISTLASKVLRDKT